MQLEKFSAQAEKKLLKQIKKLARKEGTKFYAVINEAFEDLLDKRKNEKPRKTVIDNFEASLIEFDSVYEKLAK